MTINNVEFWKPVTDYEKLYEISSQGRIRSNHKKSNPNKILKQSNTTTGYKKVELCKNGTRKSFKVHRLVASAFVPNPEAKPYVNHIDSNTVNNIVSNLEWCTQKENMLHASIHGNHQSKAWNKKDEICKKYEDGYSLRVLAKEYAGNNVGTIKRVLKRTGTHIRSLSEQKTIYKIDLGKLVKMFETGARNADIARYFNTNRHLIGVYKYKWKRGELV